MPLSARRIVPCHMASRVGLCGDGPSQCKSEVCAASDTDPMWIEKREDLPVMAAVVAVDPGSLDPADVTQKPWRKLGRPKCRGKCLSVPINSQETRCAAASIATATTATGKGQPVPVVSTVADSPVCPACKDVSCSMASSGGCCTVEERVVALQWIVWVDCDGPAYRCQLTRVKRTILIYRKGGRSGPEKVPSHPLHDQ